MKNFKILISIIPIVAIISLFGFNLIPPSNVEASVQSEINFNVNRSMSDGPSSIYEADIDNLRTQLPSDISDESFRCLAQAVYFEARSEPFEGQVAVAYVILNRVKDKRYPNNICDVVFQNEHYRNNCQFSFACDGLSDTPYEVAAWNMAQRVAGGTLKNTMGDVTARSTHYHATYVHPRWAKQLQPTIQVGNHIFYREDL
ncbi:MAG: cell wall hydrolase [Emcibacter sp.]|nr:cell wall hydrolase [Emcibacter sp.]